MTQPTAPSKGTDVALSLIREARELEIRKEKLVKPLEARLKKIKELLCDTLIQTDAVDRVDEETNWHAYIRQTLTTTWDKEKLVQLLATKGHVELAGEVLDTVVNPKGVEALRNQRILTDTELLSSGAMVKTPRKPYAIVEPMKVAS